MRRQAAPNCFVFKLCKCFSPAKLNKVFRSLVLPEILLTPSILAITHVVASTSTQEWFVFAFDGLFPKKKKKTKIDKYYFLLVSAIVECESR